MPRRMRRLKGLQAALESSSSDEEGDSLDRLRPRIVRGSKVRYDRPALQLSGADALNLSGYNLPGIIFPQRSLQPPSFADILKPASWHEVGARMHSPLNLASSMLTCGTEAKCR